MRVGHFVEQIEVEPDFEVLPDDQAQPASEPAPSDPEEQVDPGVLTPERSGDAPR